MIVIVDIGVGNLGSILNMFKKVGVRATVSRDAADIEAAQKLVLPGVGSFDEGMRRLNETGLVDLLNEQVLENRTPVLGICLGAQMLGRGSEEGRLPGLGWIDMDVVRFPASPELSVPHMGWNVLSPGRESVLFREAQGELRYYFVHSYYMKCDNETDVAGYTTYGFDFAAAVGHGNVHGVQFHPEKSHRFGAALLRNFAEFA